MARLMAVKLTIMGVAGCPGLLCRRLCDGGTARCCRGDRAAQGESCRAGRLHAGIGDAERRIIDLHNSCAASRRVGHLSKDGDQRKTLLPQPAGRLLPACVRNAKGAVGCASKQPRWRRGRSLTPQRWVWSVRSAGSKRCPRVCHPAGWKHILLVSGATKERGRAAGVWR